MVDDMLTLLFKADADVNHGDLKILATAQSKGCTCGGGPRTDNESCGHDVTRVSIVVRTRSLLPRSRLDRMFGAIDQLAD